MIKAALGCFESSSNGLNSSSNMNECFGVFRFRDLGVFEISHPKMKIKTHQEVRALLEGPESCFPMLLSQSLTMASIIFVGSE